MSTAVTLPPGLTKRGGCSGDRPIPSSKIKDMLTRLQPGTPDDVLDYGSEARVNLTKIQLRNPVPNSNLPL
jgi:hypothetical protein